MLKQQDYLTASSQRAYEDAGEAWDGHEIPKPCEVGDVSARHSS